MRKPTDSWSGIKQGYGSRSKWNTLNNKTNSSVKKKDVDYNNDKKSYPNGVIPFIFISLVFVVVLIVVFSIKAPDSRGGPGYQAKYWYNLLWYISGIPVCLVVLWAIGRAGFMSVTRYGTMKLGRQIRWLNFKTKLRERMHLQTALNDVNNLAEWEQYLNDRKVFTKKWFIITLSIYLSLFVIATIIMIVMNATNNHQ